jgi:hypothetical protein
VSTAHEFSASEPLPASLPAWGFSLGLHLVLLLAIALIVPRAKRPVEEQEPPRAASIVLVAANDATSEPRYFAESDASQPSLQPAVAADAAVASPSSSESERADSLESLLPAGPTATSTVPVELGNPLTQSRGAGRNIGRSAEAIEAEAQLIAAEQQALRKPVPTGPTTKVSIFGSAPAEGRTFTFVIDRSASMGPEGLGVLGAAAKQLDAAVQSLGPTHKFQIIAYNQRPTPLGPKSMTLATKENKALVASFFQSIGAFGSTDHELALVGALAAQPDVLFLLTDGGDPFITATQFKRLRDMARGRTTIHCIQFGKGPAVDDGERFMRGLASETGGSYTYVDVTKQ